MEEVVEYEKPSEEALNFCKMQGISGITVSQEK